MFVQHRTNKQEETTKVREVSIGAFQSRFSTSEEALGLRRCDSSAL